MKKCMVAALVGEDREFVPILKNEGLFRTVSVQIGGYGVCWGENLCIADKSLYETGTPVALELSNIRGTSCSK